MASSGEEGLRARAREPFVVVVPLSRSLSHLPFSVRSTHDAFERRSVAIETFEERGALPDPARISRQRGSTLCVGAGLGEYSKKVRGGRRHNATESGGDVD